MLRNALLPVSTTIGLQVGLLLAGAVLTEKVFAWGGIGTLLADAITERDYPRLQALLLLGALVYVLVNLLVDLSYAIIDPRVRLSMTHGSDGRPALGAAGPHRRPGRRAQPRRARRSAGCAATRSRSSAR